MSFDLKSVYDFGSGELQDVTISDGASEKLNSYARVTGIDQKIISIDKENMLEGDFEKFTAGADILIHVSASLSATAKLGKYLVAKIILASDDVLTLDKDFSTIMSTEELEYYFVQAITFANFDCLNIKKSATVMPPTYNPYHFHGGILCIKCWDTFTLEGNIKLSDCGIPTTRRNTLRPILESYQEKLQTCERFLLNAGDGAAFILAKNFICSDDARIGNPKSQGVANCEGGEDLTPSVVNVGGSSIILVADNLSIKPKNISKYRSGENGKGFAKCYIASNTQLDFDEKLYAFDVLSDKSRLKNIGVENFGAGTYSDVNPNYQLNNFASVFCNGNKLYYKNKTVKGLAALQTGAMVIVQNLYDAKFIVTKILQDVHEDYRNYFVIDREVDFHPAQIISVAEFDNLTINKSFSKIPDFDDCGGVFAVVVKGTLNLESASIDLTGKGFKQKFFGNSQSADRLPMKDFGAIFILAQNLIVNAQTKFWGNTFIAARFDELPSTCFTNLAQNFVYSAE